MSLRRAVDGVLAADFNDPTNERLIYLSAAGLVLVGLGLLVGTLIWWRRGRQEHPALAPLEVMSGRAWATAPEGERRRKLEQVRLSGAAGSVAEPVGSEPVDLEALVRNVPQAFDDLKEPSPVVAVPAVAEPIADPLEPDAAAADAAEAEVAEVGEGQPAIAETVPVEPPSPEPPTESRNQPAKVDSAPVEPSKPDAPKPDLDATSIAMERPIELSEPPSKVPVESSE
jgi:hypothetical protein